MTAESFEMGGYVLKEAIGLGTIPPKERSELTTKEIEELVLLGTSRRDENPRHWIDLMLADIEEKKPDVALVPSVRFSNEADAIRKMDGKIIRITSYVVEGVDFISRDRDPNHISEVQTYSIHADYFLTVMRGESILLGKQAATLFNYLVERQQSVQ